MLTSVAGPAMNVVLAGFFTAAYWFHVHFRDIPDHHLSARTLVTAIELNWKLALFNMLPIPPLDGHRVLGYFLPRAARETYYRIGPFGGLALLLALSYFGVLRAILWPILDPTLEWWGATFMPGGYHVAAHPNLGFH
jgi:Zn-dependent protease